MSFTRILFYFILAWVGLQVLYAAGLAFLVVFTKLFRVYQYDILSRTGRVQISWEQWITGKDKWLDKLL